MRGGHRRRQCPPALSPEQVRQAVLQLAAGRMRKQVAADLGVERSTLQRALTGRGQYAGILPAAPPPGQRGSRPILSPARVQIAAAKRAQGLSLEQIAAALSVGRETVRVALAGRAR